MKFRHYPETDSLYIDLQERPGADSREVSPGVVLDLDAEGRLGGSDIQNASEVVNLSSLEVESFPVSSVSLR